MAQKQVRTPYTSMAGTPEREVEIFLVLAVFVCSPVHMGEARPIERLDRPRGRWQAGESEAVSGGGGGGKASMARLVTTPKTAQVVGAADSGAGSSQDAGYLAHLSGGFRGSLNGSVSF